MNLADHTEAYQAYNEAVMAYERGDAEMPVRQYEELLEDREKAEAAMFDAWLVSRLKK